MTRIPCATTGKRIRIGLVDDQPIFRQGVVLALEATESLTIAAEGTSASDALRMAAGTSLDILLLGLEIPENAIAASWAIGQIQSDVKVLIWAPNDDDKLVVAALRAGAYGYIPREVEPIDLIRAIEVIHLRESRVVPTRSSTLLLSNMQTFVRH
jgi:DNA-binding NarL/FixJ family response regulator